MSRLLISALNSGSGKTAVTCGLLAALKRRGLDTHAFKCGPDYIDPMFHSRVLDIPCRNLDLFLQGEVGVWRTLNKCAGEVNILEGAMGFYDGIAGRDAGSAWQTAEITNTPVLLVVRPKGTSLTLAAQISGLLAFRPQSHIAGVLFNDCTEQRYNHLAPIVQRETGLDVFGFLPHMAEAEFESRHLGLLTAGEITDFSLRFEKIAAQMENTVKIDGILKLASTAVTLAKPERQSDKSLCCRIAVAQDKAFCFYYADNLDELTAAGAQLIYFSPLHDLSLPPNVSGLYLGGGYPELYAKQLSLNTAMLKAIRTAVNGGLPTVAECGGFLYLQKNLQDIMGENYPMAGALQGNGIKTAELQRFGYLTLTAEADSMLFKSGEHIPAHEFHHWDCTDNGDCLVVAKMSNGKAWRCGIAGKNIYAAFPHLHFGGELPIGKRFVEAAKSFKGLSV